MTRRMWLRCSCAGGVWEVWLKSIGGTQHTIDSGVTVGRSTMTNRLDTCVSGLLDTITVSRYRCMEEIIYPVVSCDDYAVPFRLMWGGAATVVQLLLEQIPLKLEKTIEWHFCSAFKIQAYRFDIKIE